MADVFYSNQVGNIPQPKVPLMAVPSDIVLFDCWTCAGHMILDFVCVCVFVFSSVVLLQNTLNTRQRVVAVDIKTRHVCKDTKMPDFSSVWASM